MEVSRIRALRGPNLWSRHTAIEAIVTCPAAECTLSPAVEQQLRRIFPEVGTIAGSRPGQTASLAHALEKVTLGLQSQAGCPVTFSRTTPTEVAGTYQVAVEYTEEAVGRLALELAEKLCQAALSGQAFDLGAALAQLHELDEDDRLGPSTGSIVDAAVARNIPFRRLTQGSLVQFGWGAKQRRIQAAEIDSTSAIAESIAQDKDLTKSLLHAAGVPVPLGRPATSLEDAWAAAQDIGLPVVVKPLDGNRGWGVSLDVNTEEGVRQAWVAAEKEGSEVLIERYVRGDEHRVLVVGDRVVAATRGETACITGDGTSTVEQLIDSQINTDPRRGIAEGFPLDLIRLHTPRGEMSLLEIQRQGLQPNSVPDKGRIVVVQRNGNLNNDVTDLVHPEVAAVATLAARVIGLDIAGIDIVTQDISRPLEETHGAIIEVNAGPGLLMHVKPAVGQPRPVGKAIVEHLFGPNESGRIPVVGISGSQQTTELAQLVAWLLHLSGKRTGLACKDGLYMDQQHLGKYDARGFEASERLLINRALDAAVFETTPDLILDEGLAYDRCLVGVVTNMPATHAGLIDKHDIQTPEQMRTVIRTQVDLVLPEGAAVLNADEEAVVSLAELSDGEVVYYAKAHDNAALQAHLQTGGRGVFCKDGHVTLARGDQETQLFHLDLELIARLLKDGLHISTLLAAVATAWSLDIAPLLIRAGLKNFGQQNQQVAKDIARMNG